MRNTFRISSILTALVFAAVLSSSTDATAQMAEPGWYPYTVARGADRTIIRQTPMHLRPYRPLHFYGNTQRRVYHRGTPLPTLVDLRRNVGATTRNLLVPMRILSR